MCRAECRHSEQKRWPGFGLEILWEAGNRARLAAVCDGQVGYVVHANDTLELGQLHTSIRLNLLLVGRNLVYFGKIQHLLVAVEGWRRRRAKHAGVVAPGARPFGFRLDGFGCL